VKRPAIGITMSDEDGKAGFHVLREDYVRSVEDAGGLALLLPPGQPSDAPLLLDRLDGLLLSGGADIDPALYAQVPHPKLGRVVRARDDFELALCREALHRDLPILAICRGQQVLNVATGGTLVQDIPSVVVGAGDHDPPAERWEPVHEVDLLQGSRLRDILGRERVEVNSFHHQAVDALGDGLSICARAVTDRVVEGVEDPQRRFVLGVQWHPEAFWREPRTFGALFEALVGAARP
jgi:putative glutamine amidotransferase